MEYLSSKGFGRLCWVMGLSFFLFPLALQAAPPPALDHYAFTSVLPGTNHTVDEQVSYTVEAQDNTDTRISGFSGSVTVGLYDTSTVNYPTVPILLDPQAVIEVGGSPVGSGGTAVLSFVDGTLVFDVVFKTGSDNESLLLSEVSGIIRLDHGFYIVKGYTSTYYLRDANNASPFAVYPGANDILDPDPNVPIIPTISPTPTPPPTPSPTPVAYTIPFSADGSVAAVFVITGITGRYAAGGADLDGFIRVRKSGGSGTANIVYKMILDYDGTLPATGGPDNYVTPRGGIDTVYQGNFSTSNGNFSTAPAAVFQVGSLPISSSTVMNGGQVVLMVWNTSALAQGELLLKTVYGAAVPGSNISVPFSDSNISPVQGILTPKQFLVASPASPLVYEIKNYSGYTLGKLNFRIPPNPGAGTGTPWTLSSAVLDSGHPGSISTLNPSGTTAGYVNIDWTSSTPVPNGQSAFVTLAFSTASDVTKADWDFGFTLVRDGADAQDLISDSIGAKNIETLGAPPAPSVFQADPANYNGAGNQVDLSWEQITAESANGYVITRSPAFSAPGSIVINFNSTTTYPDTTALNQTPYTYQIASKNNVALSSTFASNSVTPFANPGSPTGVAALTGGTTVRLNWTAPVSVSGSYDIGGYQIFRGTATGTETFLTAVGPVLTYDDTTVSGGVTYFYQIASVDSEPVTGTPGTGAHISGYSLEVSGFPLGNPPVNPSATFLIATIPDTIQVAWSAPLSNLFAPINYVIEKTVNAGAPTTFSASSPYDDTAVAAGDTYTYRIAANLGAGVTTNFSASVIGRVGPSAPTGLSASPQAPSGSAITLTWTANPGPENVVRYNLYRDATQIATPATSVPVISSGLVQGVNYSYTIEAVDGAGVIGPLSSPVVSAMLPNAPQNLTALSNAATRYFVDLAWAAPVSSLNVTGYNLYRNTTSAFPAGTPTPIPGGAGLPTSPLSFQDTSLTSANAGTTFFYFLKAQNPGGEGVSVVKGLQIPPNPPSAPVPSVSAAAITLVWPANLGSENVTFYAIYRDSGSGFVSVGRVNNPGTSFTDTAANGVSPGVNYPYYITATNPGSGATIIGGASLASVTITSGRLPQVPTGFAVSGITTGNDISVTWTNVLTPVPNATSLDLLKGITNNPAAAVTTNLAASSVSFFDSGAGNNPGTTYYYWLKTNNAYGSGGLAGPVSQLTRPGAPTFNFLTLAPDESRLADWSILGGSVTAYNVYRSQSSSGPFFKVQTVSAAGLAMPVTLNQSIQPGQVYYYKITAQNATGEGPDSGLQSVNMPPSSPLGVTAVSGISNVTNRVDLSWLANAPIENVADYNIYRATSNATTAAYGAPLVSNNPTTVYSDNSAVDGTPYFYIITANSASFTAESILNTTNAVAVTAYALPNPPGSLAVTAGTSQVSLGWNASVVTTYPILGYDVYQSTSASVTGVKVNATPVPGIAYTATGLNNGTTYYYRVQAVDVQGHLGPFAGPVSEMPVAPPSVPIGVSAIGGDNAVQVTWNPATQGTLPWGEYYLYRADAPSTSPTTLVAQLGVSYTGFVDTTAVNGTNYVYWVQSVDSSGITLSPHASVLSAPVTMAPAPTIINPPGNVSGIFGNAAVTIYWDNSSPVAGAPVTGYELSRATVQTGPYSAVVTVAAGAGPYVQPDPTSVVNGTQYYYYLRAYASTGSISAASAIVQGIPSVPPVAPTPVIATDGSNQVALNWSPSPPPSGSVTISRYVIYRQIPPDGLGASAVSIGSTIGPVTTFTDLAASNGTDTEYYVSAVNSNYIEGLKSAPVTGFPYTMAAPTGLGSVSTNADITVSWTAIPGPSSSYPVTGYTLIRTPVGGGVPDILDDPDGASPYIDTSMALGQLYTYTVLGTDDKGHTGPASAPVTDGASNPPPAPSPFVALAGSEQILLDWAPVTATSSTFAASQYILTRSSGPTTILPATQTWFLDTNADNVTSVSYTLTVVDITSQNTSYHMSTPATPVPNPVTGNVANINPPTAVLATALNNTTIRVSWTPPTDMGRVIDRYVLYQGNSFNVPLSGGVTIPRSPINDPLFHDVPGLGPNQTYYFVMVGLEAGTNTASSSSNHAWATTLANGSTPPVSSGEMLLDANLLRPLLSQQLGIFYLVPASGTVDITIYTIAGNPIRKLTSTATSGVQGSVLWDGRDRNGFTVASGLYLIEIKIGSFHQVKKVAVVK